MKENQNTQTLIQTLKARGWQNATRTMLDVIEPIAPLLSQFLWVLQPFSSVLGEQKVVAELAEALDTPAGIEALRQQLDQE